MPPPLVGHYVPSSWERVATPSDLANTARTTVDYTATNQEGQITASTSVFGGGSRSSFTLPDFDAWLFSEQQPSSNSSTKGQINPQHYETSVSTFNTEPPTAVQQGAKVSRRAAKRDKWESIKEEVRQLYVLEGKTLEATMMEMQRKYSFKASLRKWKMQTKEWGFDKNLSKNDMAILVAKAEKRKRDDGKETKFYNGGQEIRSERLAGFKKRKMAETIDAPSPSAATPMNITYDTPRFEANMDDIEKEETTFPDNDCHALNLFLLRDSVSHAFIAGVMSIGVTTGARHPLIPMDIRDHASNFNLERHELEKETDRRPSAIPTPSIVQVDPAVTAEAAANELPLAMKETWSSDETAVCPKRLTRVYLDRHQPTRRFIGQLALADFKLADVSLGQRPLLEAQKLVISSLFEFLPEMKHFWEVSASPPDIYQLDESTLAWLAAVCMQDYPHMADGQVLRSMIRMIEKQLLIHEEEESNIGNLRSFKLVIMLTSAAMMCGRANALDALTIFDEIISKTQGWKGGLASIMQAYSFICRAFHCTRLGNQSQSEEDVETAWVFMNEIAQSKQRDTMTWFWRFAQRNVSSRRARNAEQSS
ncbi:uncharacterized protein PAC_06161 [Phialocephala subalpina]|uniref:Clr5 domain-containing protein n=1 Tax=Phialocephala subalpina TaxID=576137 RepID=A0A1L7WU67_9HELO|nr:uncharacterized protein PAC_06161 [Phialocephala subalpina]